MSQARWILVRCRGAAAPQSFEEHASSAGAAMTRANEILGKIQGQFEEQKTKQRAGDNKWFVATCHSQALI
jgi:hypothetical protein